MNKKQSFKEYLKKSFIQYAVVLFFAVLLLVIGFFVFNYYMNVVQHNKTTNEEVTKLFTKEYSRYQDFVDELAKDESLIELLSDGTNSSRQNVSSMLYDFANSGDFKAYFLVSDDSGNTILSNLNKNNQSAFIQSSFMKRITSRISSSSDDLVKAICDVEMTYDQDLMYSFARGVFDNKNDLVGYIFLNMRAGDIRDYAYLLNEDVLIVDRFNNAIFASYTLQKDPGDKFPERRVTLDVDKNGIYEVAGEKRYVRVNHLSEEIDIYTLTSIKGMIDMLRLAGGFFLLMFIAVGILMTLMTRLYTKINERGARDLMRDLEVKNLEEQFNPHFVFNVMESVRFQIDEDPKKAQNMLLAFSTLMRYSINHGHSKVRLETDIDYLNDFLMLQKIRYNNLLTYDFHIPDELLDCMVPKLLLQPIIENCIRHGFVQGRELHIDIDAKQEGNNIIFNIKDNGKGITEERLKQIRESFEEEVSDETVKHVGLYNVEKVLSMLYGEQYGLTINSKIDEGTNVLLNIPYELEEEDV